MQEENGKRNELREEPANDIYAGYYWGNDPYESYDMPGRKTYEDLKSIIKEHLRRNSKINSVFIEVSVNSETVILTGHVKNLPRKTINWRGSWSIPGIAKVLNDLEVLEPETAGPSKQTKE
jgi:osmotically-inducible protein OsmY